MFTIKTNSNYMAKFCFDLGIVSMIGCMISLDPKVDGTFWSSNSKELKSLKMMRVKLLRLSVG